MTTPEALPANSNAMSTGSACVPIEVQSTQDSRPDWGARYIDFEEGYLSC